MRHSVLFLLLSGASLLCGAQSVHQFVQSQMQAYPKARLLDLYKSCYQDFMGAEHLVSDSASAGRYLDRELRELDEESLLQWYYEPCGVDGNFVRISLRAVAERVLSKEQLLSAFLRSASGKEMPGLEAWKARWAVLVDSIGKMNLNLPHEADDKVFLADVLSQDRYAISHSADYREAYNPHYRIVRRDIFEREFKSLLEPYQRADANGYIVFDGDMCPDFEVTLTDGRRVRMQDLRGKVVMLQFTASWCSVCRREMPFIERDIWQRHKDDDRFVLIGIDRDEPLQKVLRFAQATGITYPLALDPGADVYAKFALRNSGITRNVLVGPDGRILQRTRLYHEDEFRSLVQAIDAALANATD